MAEPIISVSGLRGVIGTELTPDTVARYIAAFCTTLPKGLVVLGRDGRESGRMFSSAAKATLLGHGMSVLDADVIATPTVGYAVKHFNAVGGIQVSASHNPIEYNGLKLFNSDGRVFPAVQGEKVLDAYRRSETKWVTAEEIGHEHPATDPHDAHLRAIYATVDVAKIRQRHFRVLLDSNHGAGSIAGKRLLEHLGFEFTLVGDQPDGRFAHPPEPTAENLNSITQLVRTGGYDMGFCQDPDADRLAIIDEKGNYIGEEFSAVLCMLSRLETSPGPIVTNCASSSMSAWLANKFQVPFARSKVGEANVVDRMIETNAVYGGEGSGGPIDPKVGYIRDSLVAMAQVADLLARRGCTLSEVVASFPKRVMIKDKIVLGSHSLNNLQDSVVKLLKPPSVDQMDGVRLDWQDRWLLLRGSNTEPIARIIAEADNHSIAAEMITLVKKAIQSSL